MDATRIKDYAQKLEARIKAVHDNAHQDCSRWESFQQPIFIGTSRKATIMDGFGCPDHHVWIEGSPA